MLDEKRTKHSTNTNAAATTEDEICENSNSTYADILTNLSEQKQSRNLASKRTLTKEDTCKEAVYNPARRTICRRHRQQEELAEDNTSETDQEKQQAAAKVRIE